MRADRVRKILTSLLVAGFWLLLWEVLCLLVKSSLLLPSPFAVASRLMELVMTARFWRVIASSVLRVLSGFLLGVLAGCVLGICTAYSPILRRLFKLPMSVVKAAPVASFVILALVWISGKNLSIFISFLMVLPIVHSNIEQGLLSADEKLLEAAIAYRLSPGQRAIAVYIPAAAPYFLSALRVGLGLAFKSGIAGEVIAIPKNAIGTELYNAKVYLQTPDLFAWTLVIVAISMALEKALSLLIGRAVRLYGGEI